ncbi:hypothetical protein V500_03883, partial [Pseudogymnoascus sp. VKM F-4518 (FW-2643)]
PLQPHWEFEAHLTGSSHTGNLRAYLTGSYKAKLAEVCKGTNSAYYVYESARFFEATMQNHTLYVKAKEEGKAVSNYAPHCPFLPVKKDSSAHKAQMRLISTITYKCNGCKKAKEKTCLPTNLTNACNVWNHFTNDEEEEASSPLSALQVILDKEDKDNDDDDDDE